MAQEGVQVVPTSISPGGQVIGGGGGGGGGAGAGTVLDVQSVPVVDGQKEAPLQVNEKVPAGVLG